MSADDQTFLDTLNAVGADVRKYSDDAFNLIEKGVDKAAAVVRDTLSSQRWVPDAVRPKPPPPPPVAEVASNKLHNRIVDWVLEHKLLTGTFVLGITATTIGLVYRSRRNYSKKRRARRAGNGARVEVVILAGSPSEPAVRSIALDLERRGFIVFIVCNDVDEEVMVQNESRSDIRPLSVDISRPHHSIERFRTYLQTPQHAFDGAKPHYPVLTSLILLPSLTYPSAPLATLSASAVGDIFNTRLIHPILLTQAFLPLLTSLPMVHPHHQPHHLESNPKVLVITPSIISSLNPPFHIPESVCGAALKAFTQSLTSELALVNIPVNHLKLGTFDFSTLQSKMQANSRQAHRAETLSWPQEAREAYGSNYLAMMERGGTAGRRGGSSLRELHNAVFDAIETRQASWWTFGHKLTDFGCTKRVGQGCGTYAFVGAFIPRGLVGWMMGMRRVERTDVIERDESDEEAGMSRSLARSDEFVSVRYSEFPDKQRQEEEDYNQRHEAFEGSGRRLG